MRYCFFLCMLSFISCQQQSAPTSFKLADNVVVAHRGAWKANNLPENSLASLRHAIELNCVGSEFDVRMTADDVLIVAHDADYHDMVIEETNYAELNAVKLSNGEDLPTLEAMLIEGLTDNSGTGMVCEIKPSKTKARGRLIAEKVMALVKSLDASHIMASYISFDYQILKRIIELDPKANTQYLDGSKSPEVLKKDGVSGLDYYLTILKNKPSWINSAKELGISLNAWTVNKAEDLDWLLANEFDFITTNEPELLFERIEASPIQAGWKLVWSDEFSGKGKPDPTKWAYEYGFISNQEEQYYTDSLKNARLENGHLIIEAHQDQIPNPYYKSDAFKDKPWLQYIAEIDTAKYSAARLTTKGLAAWKYGRIEVRAKLPKGVGLWPAVWMLGENRTEVGWPECGEIDIMEHVGFSPDSIFGTVHTMAYNHNRGTQKGKSVSIAQPYDDFHVFAIDWSEEQIDFYLDGTRYYQFKNAQKTSEEWPFDQKFYLILNVAVGGMLGGQQGIDQEIFPQAMQIDYVRVYQKKHKQ